MRERVSVCVCVCLSVCVCADTTAHRRTQGDTQTHTHVNVFGWCFQGRSLDRSAIVFEFVLSAGVSASSIGFAVGCVAIPETTCTGCVPALLLKPAQSTCSAHLLSPLTHRLRA